MEDEDHHHDEDHVEHHSFGGSLMFLAALSFHSVIEGLGLAETNSEARVSQLMDEDNRLCLALDCG